MQISAGKRQRLKIQYISSPIGNTGGGAAGIVMVLVLVLVLAGGAGYWAYDRSLQKKPLKTRLASVKMKAEVIHFIHDRVSTALYHNLVMLDDTLVMVNREMDRLKRIAKKFPNQSGIITSQTRELTATRERLSGVMDDVTAKIETIYVTWLVNRSKGIGQINSQRGTLTRQLAEALRGEAVLIGRIRSHPDSAS